MSERILPAIVAILLGGVLVVAAFVPYVAHSYRRRGALGPGHALLAAAALVHALAVVAYVLLPLPDVGPDFCTVHHAATGLQLHPLQFLSDIRTEQLRSGGRGLLDNPAVQQVAFNVALFVPLGALLRHLGGRSVAFAALAGFVVSLFVELTQLTGNWFLYPCPYRLFDVDDLLANTAGAVAGALAAPSLRLVPGQVGPDTDPGAPRPVTTGRRLLGALCDLLGFWLVDGVASTLLVAGWLLLGWSTDTLPNPTFVVWVVLFVVVPMLGRGGTIGHRAVLLRPVHPDGSTPSRGRLLGRSLAGIGGFLLLQSLGGGLAGLAGMWGLVCLVGIVATRGHRGIGGVWTRTELADRRPGPRPLTADEGGPGALYGGMAREP